MTTVEQATDIVLSNTISLGTESVPIKAATGRVLQEKLIADRDFPPFNRVSMDGISIDFEKFKNGQKTFNIEGLQAAGTPQLNLKVANNCLEVMTGAVLPIGTDTVIRYEDIAIKDGAATINIEDVRKGQNVHKQGFDRKTGAVIVNSGTIISPAEIGVAASVGKSGLQVSQLPRIAVISTGDELVEIDDQPLPHQIRKSNVHNLAATASQWGLTPELLHLPDEKEAIKEVLSKALTHYDALILSGGVSAGKLDFVPEVLEELGVEKLFHKVTQRPGKPFWFGKTNRASVFAFPGNPVSSFMCMNRYFQPWLRKSIGLPPFKETFAVLGKDFSFRPDLTYFLQVKITFGIDGKLMGAPIEGKGSGDLANLVEADAFMELPRGRNDFKAGEIFPVWMYR